MEAQRVNTPASPLRRYIGPAIITGFIVIAIVIGLAPRGPKGNFIQSSEFQLVMDRTRSGEPQPLPGRMSVTPIATIRTDDGRYCRPYRLTGSIDGSGLVCRSDGEWLSEARSDATDSDGSLASAKAALGGDLLAADTEASLVATNWRS